LAGVELVEDTPGARVMAYGKATTPGEFDAECFLFAGINYLYEGITVS
jgi:hypothetical protein